jgi:hypothetical protein
VVLKVPLSIEMHWRGEDSVSTCSYNLHYCNVLIETVGIQPTCVSCCRKLQELSRQSEDQLSSTTELYKTQVEQCNVLIAEVRIFQLPTNRNDCK